jgi:hypothetical protein
MTGKKTQKTLTQIPRVFCLCISGGVTSFNGLWSIRFNEMAYSGTANYFDVSSHCVEAALAGESGWKLGSVYNPDITNHISLIFCEFTGTFRVELLILKKCIF